MDVGIAAWIAPCGAQTLDCVWRQLCQQSFILADRKLRFVRADGKCIEQFARCLRPGAHAVAGGSEVAEQRDHACRHVESDRIAGASGRAGIIRHQDGDAPFFARRGSQPHERSNPIRDHRDPVRLRPVHERRERKPIMLRQWILEGHDAREHAAVEFGQNHVHREIGGAEPARAVAPCGALGGRSDDLEDGNVGAVEWRRVINIAAGRKSRRRDDQSRIKPRERVANERCCVRVLQAGDQKRGWREAARRQGVAQHIDRRGVSREQHGAVEDNRHNRAAGDERRCELIEIDRALARQITRHARDRRRFCRLQRNPRMAGQTAQQRTQVFAAAFAEIAQQRVELLRRQCRRRGKANIVAVFARASTASAMPRSRARTESRSMPYFHQSSPPSRRIRMTLACAPTRSIHRSTDIGWRRSRRCVSRTLGSAGRSIAHAAASAARSLSANESTRISPGGWPRSTGSTISSRLVDVVASRCIVYPSSARVTAARSKPFRPITTRRPWRVSAAVHGRSY